MRHILKSVHRRILAWSLVMLIGGAPQAIVCALACAEHESMAAAGDHRHDRHAGHHASATVPDVGIEATPHDCDSSDQWPNAAEPAANVKASHSIVTSALTLEPLARNQSTFSSVVAQYPPGSSFLSTQLRI